MAKAVRISDELYESLSELATRDARSITGYVHQVLAGHVRGAYLAGNPVSMKPTKENYEQGVK